MSVSEDDRGIRGIVDCGAVSKDALLKRLAATGVQMNDYARLLFGSQLFLTAHDPFTVDVVETSPAALGMSTGATLPAIIEAAASRGLRPCPLELGPHLRLQHLSGTAAEGPQRLHRAPPGSITIVSDPLVDDDEFPKGFYLRTIDGTPWLRGYCCSLSYEWDAMDRLVFRTG